MLRRSLRHLKKFESHMSLDRLQVVMGDKFSHQFHEGLSDGANPLDSGNSSKLSFHQDDDDDITSNNLFSTTFTSSFASRPPPSFLRNNNYIEESSSLLASSAEENEDGEAEEDEFGFASRIQMLDQARRYANGQHHGRTSNNTSDAAQSPEKALRVAESCFTSLAGYTYATTPLVDIVFECYREGLITKIDQSSSSSSSSSSIAVSSVNDTSGNNEQSLLKKKGRPSGPKKYYPGFENWFHPDPLTICKNPNTLAHHAGSDRAEIMIDILSRMGQENEKLILHRHKRDGTISVRPLNHLVSASPLTRVLFANGLINYNSNNNNSESNHLLQSKVEPWKKLVRGIALALCRNDIYLDLPTLSTAIINDDKSLLLHSSSGLMSLSDLLKYRTFEADDDVKKTNFNKQKGTSAQDEDEEDFQLPFQQQTQSSSSRNNNNKFNLSDYTTAASSSSSSFSSNSSADERDRTILWVKLLLGAGAECGSYSAILHAAEILKSRNMETTLDMQRLMAVGVHAHMRREQDWKFRFCGGLRNYGRSWLYEYFPRIEKERKFNESGF